MSSCWLILRFLGSNCFTGAKGEPPVGALGVTVFIVLRRFRLDEESEVRFALWDDREEWALVLLDDREEWALAIWDDREEWALALWDDREGVSVSAVRWSRGVSAVIFRAKKTARVQPGTFLRVDKLTSPTWLYGCFSAVESSQTCKFDFETVNLTSKVAFTGSATSKSNWPQSRFQIWLCDDTLFDFEVADPVKATLEVNLTVSNVKFPFWLDSTAVFRP